MKKNMTFTKLLRVTMAMMLIVALLLCGCGKKESEEPAPTKKEPITLGDGDGKLEAQDFVDGTSTIYGLLLDAAVSGETGSSDGMGMEMNLSITLGDTLKSMISSGMASSGLDTDLSWLKNIGMKMISNMDGDLMQEEMTLLLNGKEIAGANIIVDMANMAYYVSLPGINDDFLKLDLGSMMGSSSIYGTSAYDTGDLMGSLSDLDVEALLEQLGEVADKLPTEEELNAVLTKYVNVAIEALGAPEVTTETLSYGGVSQTVTATTYEIRISNVLNMGKQLLLTAQDDEDLEKFLDSLGNAMAELGAGNVDLHGQLMNVLPEALEEINAEIDGLTVENDRMGLKFVAYTAGEEQVGFEFSTYSYSEHYYYDEVLDMYVTELHNSRESSNYYYTLCDGNKTAFVLSVGDDFRVEGTGTKNGDNTSGSYAVIIDGEEVLTAETNSAKGTLRLIPSEEMLEEMGAVASFLPNPVLELSCNGESFTMNLLSNEQVFLGITGSLKTTNGDKVSLPKKYEEMGEYGMGMVSWMMGMDIDNVLDNLEDAGVPDSLMELLESALDMGF